MPYFLKSDLFSSNTRILFPVFIPIYYSWPGKYISSKQNVKPSAGGVTHSTGCELFSSGSGVKFYFFSML